jgi:uncharacterized protein (DUF849 family)
VKGTVSGRRAFASWAVQANRPTSGLGHELPVGVTTSAFRMSTQTGHCGPVCGLPFGDDWCWSILAAGRHRMPFCNMGANVRVGLGDSLYLGQG